jgi:hypothetical protein
MQDGSVVITPDGNWRTVESTDAKCVAKGIQFETPINHIPIVKLATILLNYPQAIIPNCYVDETDRFRFVFLF